MPKSPGPSIEFAEVRRGTAARPRYLTVAHLNPKRRGSMEDQFAHLASFLDERGVDADFLFSEFPILPVKELLRRRGAEIGRIDFARPLASARALYDVVRERGYRVVHFHFMRPHSPLVLAAKAAGARVLLTDHMSLLPPKRLSVKARVRLLLSRGVDLRLPVSGALADVVTKTDGKGAGRLVVVNNGVDLERFQPAPERRAALREELGLGEEPVILCVARFAPVKGVAVLLEAVARATPGSALSRARVLLAGDGPLRGELETLAKARGLDARVVFLGLRSDLESIYPAADVVSVPSVGFESCSLAVLEAQATAVPAVASAIGGVPEHLVDGVGGLLVKPGDADELAKALELLLGNPALRARLGAEGRKFVEKRYGVEVWAKKLYSLTADRFPALPTPSLTPQRPTGTA